MMQSCLVQDFWYFPSLFLSSIIGILLIFLQINVFEWDLNLINSYSTLNNFYFNLMCSLSPLYLFFSVLKTFNYYKANKKISLKLSLHFFITRLFALLVSTLLGLLIIPECDFRTLKQSILLPFNSNGTISSPNYLPLTHFLSSLSPRSLPHDLLYDNNRFNGVFDFERPLSSNVLGIVLIAFFVTITLFYNNYPYMDWIDKIYDFLIQFHNLIIHFYFLTLISSGITYYAIMIMDGSIFNYILSIGAILLTVFLTFIIHMLITIPLIYIFFTRKCPLGVNINFFTCIKLMFSNPTRLHVHYSEDNYDIKMITSFNSDAGVVSVIVYTLFMGKNFTPFSYTSFFIVSAILAQIITPFTNDFFQGHMIICVHLLSYSRLSINPLKLLLLQDYIFAMLRQFLTAYSNYFALALIKDNSLPFTIGTDIALIR